MNGNTQPNPVPKGEQCQCANCGLTFVGLRAFDRHRAGDYGLPTGNPNKRRCRDVPEMLTLGMQLITAGLWRIPRGTANPASELCTESFQGHAGVALGAATAATLRTPLIPSVLNSREACV